MDFLVVSGLLKYQKPFQGLSGSCGELSHRVSLPKLSLSPDGRRAGRRSGMHACMHACMHTYIHTYHIHIRTYLPTVRTYIHTHTYTDVHI